MTLSRSPVALAAAAALALSACGGAEPPVEDPTAEAAAALEAARAGRPAEPRIPPAPTGENELPAAVLGRAPAPRGAPLHYVSGDSATTGYIALPEGSGPFPAVVLIHEWDGLKDRVRQVADALAEEGYVALAADLFAGRTGEDPAENRALVQEVQADPAAMIANLDAAVRYLRARPDVSGKVAALGWCFGGGVALSYGLGGENHDGTAIFYGSLLADPDSLARLGHEVYGTFGEMDQGIPVSRVEAFVDALDAAGLEYDVHVYDDVGHGFWLRVDEDPETRAVPAVDAWRRLKSYLGRVIGPGRVAEPDADAGGT